MLSDNVLYKLVSCSDLKKKKKKKCMRTSLFIKTNGIQDNVQVFFMYRILLIAVAALL